MKPETKEFFDCLEPLVQATSTVNGSPTTDFSQLGEIRLDVLTEFVELYVRPRHLDMHSVLSWLWEVFLDKKIMCLIDRPKYSSFEFEVIGQQVTATVVTVNCGRYEETFLLEGLAQRMYLCNLLARLNAGVPVQRYHHKDFSLTFDGTHLGITTLCNEPATA